MTDKRDLEDHEHIDDGLKMAFGEAGGSVLDRIESISGTRSRILLRDAPEGASPILRVPGPQESGSATDDSRYQFVGEIARGGVGVIYKGRDKDLGRDVALKVLRTEFAKDHPVIQRFIEEAQVGAQLQHPGIVPIYGLGLQADGKPYFAMKLIKGETLTALLERGEKSSVLIGVFERIAQTMAYAHDRGVIHRDLKSTNVMVGAFGEAQVVDWGFAKVLGRPDTARQHGDTMVATVRSGGEGSQSIMGSVMGTPGYMPPEQAMGQVDELTERADVFSLGAILCEILTRQPPYTGTVQDQLLAAAQARLDQAHARLTECNAPDAIKQLARDCLAPLPKDRPANAGVVAQRLADHLASVEERAQQAELDAVHAAAETRKAKRARRTTLTLAAVALVALLGGGLGYAAWNNAERERAEQIAAQVAPLLREATRLEGEEKWPDARAAAATAVALAESGGADFNPLAAARKLHDRIEAKAEAADSLATKRAREKTLLNTLDELVMQAADHSAAQQESRYLAAFREFGLDVEHEDATTALADFSRPVPLAVHLDDWARLRRKNNGADWAGLDRLARAIDDDDWRNRIRDHAASKDTDALRKLAASDELDEQAPATLVSLAMHLDATGDPEGAVRLLRRGRVRHPGYFSIQYRLARILAGPPLSRPAEAMPHAKAALALRPDSCGAWWMLGWIRWRLKDYDRAILALERALEIDPGSVGAHMSLGTALADKGNLDGAAAAYREALRIDPARRDVARRHAATLARMFEPRMNAILEGRDRPGSAVESLGVAELLASLQRHSEALPFFRQAFETEPKLVGRNGFAAARSAVAVATAQSRALALAWMRSTLEELRPVVARNPDRVARTLRHWKRDDGLANVDPAANEELPEAERADWNAFWADVEALLERVTK